MTQIRAMTIGITALWVAAMVLLIQHDLLPRFLAGDPPKPKAEAENLEYGVFTGAGMRVGTSWMEVQPIGKTLSIRSQTFLDNLSAVPLLTALANQGAIRIQTELIYLDQEINGLDVNVWGLTIPITVHGARGGGYFAVMMQAGSFKSAMTFSGEEALAISDLMRPMTRLANLHVGQSWRVKALEPLSLAGSGRFRDILVRVTGKEDRTAEGQVISCYKIESEAGFTAWVDEAGQVVEQQVQPAGIGLSLRMIREPYDSWKQSAAVLKVPAVRRMESK